MSSLRIDTGRSDSELVQAERLSYSQLASYAKCSKAWELARYRKVPRRPGVWLAAGTAVHRVIEKYLRTTVVPLR